MSRAGSKERDQVDVAEIKKALATGNTRDSAPSASASQSHLLSRVISTKDNTS